MEILLKVSNMLLGSTHFNKQFRVLDIQRQKQFSFWLSRQQITSNCSTIIENWNENNITKTYWQSFSQTIFGNIVLIGNMTNMYVKRNSLWRWVRIVKTKFVHSASWGFKLKLITRCSLRSVHCIIPRRCHLHKIPTSAFFHHWKSLLARKSTYWLLVQPMKQVAY